MNAAERAEEAASRLTAHLGDVVTRDRPTRERSRTDRSGFTAPGLPTVVVRATSVAHVQATLRIASELRVPVVIRGAGTGLAGGACGTDASIVLSMAGLNRILEIRADDELAVVQAGVINEHLNDALAEHGLWFAPDPASRAISTIGGNIATNAGGLLCAKYGVTREAVLGLSVVLADGTLLHTGHRTVKGVAGYDLTALLTGSEGTLGVIVEATVRLQPVPGAAVTIGATFGTVRQAAAAAAAVTAARLRPAVMELLDPVALGLIIAYLAAEPRTTAAGRDTRDGQGHDDTVETVETVGPGAFLLLQTDGAGALAEAERALEVVRSAGGTARLERDPRAAQRLLALRRAMHPAMERHGTVLIEDLCVPRSRMAEMFDVVARISARTGLLIPVVAHAADGNLHPNFVIPPQPDGGRSIPDAVWAAAEEMFRAALRLGGTLTGEHGVGVLKRRWLAEDIGDTSLQLQRRVKAVFDPLNILGPGTMFDAEKVTD